MIEKAGSSRALAVIYTVHAVAERSRIPKFPRRSVRASSGQAWGLCVAAGSIYDTFASDRMLDSSPTSWLIDRQYCVP